MRKHCRHVHTEVGAAQHSGLPATHRKVSIFSRGGIAPSLSQACATIPFCINRWLSCSARRTGLDHNQANTGPHPIEPRLSCITAPTSADPSLVLARDPSCALDSSSTWARRRLAELAARCTMFRAHLEHGAPGSRSRPPANDLCTAAGAVSSCLPCLACCSTSVPGPPLRALLQLLLTCVLERDFRLSCLSSAAEAAAASLA